MRCRLAVVLLAVGCARGRSDEPILDGAPELTADARKPDAGPPDGTNPSSTCAQAFTGTLATWSFAGETGSQAATAVTTKAAGITAGPITRSAGVTAVSGATSINSSNWPLGAQLDATKYYAFTIAPPSGCKLVVTAATIDAKASGTGPASGAAASSIDTYATTTAVSTAAPGTITLAITATAMIEVRIYGFAATATGGTFRLQNALSIDGRLE